MASLWSAVMGVCVRFVAILAVLGGLVGGGNAEAQPADGARPDRPNVVILFADDLGYGDIGPFGHPTIRTPHLDRMAEEGMTLTQFYAAASVCTPSRAGLLTGRLPVRSGMASNQRRNLFPDSPGGLPQSEITVAEALRDTGYATAAIGKWHLGHLPEHLPTEHGFDRYFGVPYSNNMSPQETGWRGARDFPPIPLLRNKTIVEQPVRQETLTRRYTEEAQSFIAAHEDQPFFLYLAYTSPHTPLYASSAFRDTSARGRYGDVVEELDWSVGQVLETLHERGLDERTLVVFTSDNGPWASQAERGGTAGLLRGAKGSTFEGGMRVPTLAWWPGTIEEGTVSLALGSTMDLFTTALTLAGTEMPDDRVIDGENLLPVVKDPRAEGRDHIFFYRRERLYAVRMGPWKAHFRTRWLGGRLPRRRNPPLLYNLEHDPSEQHNKARVHPAVIDSIRHLVKRHRRRLERGEDQLDGRITDGPLLPLERAPEATPADSTSR